MPLDRSLGLIKYSYRDFLRFVWSLVRPYRARFWWATALRLSADLVWLYPSYGIARAITILGRPQSDHVPHEVIMIGVWWGLATIWRTISMYLSQYYGFGVAERAGIDAQRMTTAHLLRLDMSWQQREGAGNKMKRIDRGSLAVTRSVRIWFMAAVEIFVNLFGMIFIISRITPGLGLGLVVFVVTFLVLSTFMTRYASAMETIVDEKEEEIHGLAFEGVNNIRTVKTLDLGPTIMRRLETEWNDLFKKIQTRIRRFRNRSTVLNTWGQLFRYVSMAIVVVGIVHGHYTIGFLVLFQTYFNRLWESVNQISELAPDIVTAKYAVARIAHILNEPVQIDRTEGKRPFPTSWSMLTIGDLSFSYESTPVLEHISLSVRRGERVGIVGLSGAGKSTLFKLLLKEHEATIGNIHLDDVPLIDIDRRDYLRSVAAVLQDTEVFNYTLRENITIARPDGTEAELQEALAVAHVQDFLHKLPKGLDTIIGEKGFRLSGGEKQRVGLARAIFKRPQLLLLDEATSHLDIESERSIQDSLQHVFRSVTAIVIAHRLTTIQQMDRILVLEQGHILESGSFAELLAANGRFATLWNQQQLS